MENACNPESVPALQDSKRGLAPYKFVMSLPRN